MNELPYPLGPGDKITSTWISQLLRAIRRMKPLQGPGISTRVTPDGTVLSAASAAPVRTTAQPSRPFEVRRVLVTEDGEDGRVAKWCIFLPSNSLYIAQAAVDATDGLTAANGAPADWYELPAFPGEEESGSVYLHVTLPEEETGDESGEETEIGDDAEIGEETEGEDESHEAEAEIVTEFGEQGERDFYIEIAAIASDGKVLQKVVGTLVVDKDWKTGVTSLNELDGDITIEGGHKIDVTTEGQTIRIDFNEDKPDDDDGDDGSGDYCNAISSDGSLGDYDEEDDGWLDGFGGGGAADGENEISKWPCDNGEEGELAE